MVPLESLAKPAAHGTIKIVPEDSGSPSAQAGNVASPIPKVKRKVLRWNRQPLIRLQVFVCWSFVAFLLLITRSEVAWLWFKVTSAAALMFFLWPYIDGPYRLYRWHRVPLRPNLHRISAPPDPSPQPHQVAGLIALEFISAGHLVMETEQNVVLHLEMFLHHGNQDSAHVAEIMSGLNTHHLVGFKSRFDDGFAIETNDHSMPAIFAPDPDYRVFRFPQVRRIGDLYRLHRKVKERFLASHRPILADADGEVAASIARSELVHQRHARRGTYKLAPSGEYYVYTWHAAIRHGWLQAWPIKRLRTIRIYGRANKMVSELGFRIHPKLGYLEDPNHPLTRIGGEPRRRRRL